MLIIFIIFYLSFLFIDLIPLKEKGKNRDFWLYSVMMLVSFMITTALSIGMTIPSPAKLIEKIIQMF